MKNRVLHSLLLVADVGWILGALLLAFLLRYDGMASYREFRPFLPLLITSPLLWVAIYYAIDLDCFRWTWNVGSVISRILLGVMSLMALLLTIEYLMRVYVSRLTLGYYTVLLFCGLILIRYAARSALMAYARLGARRRIVISGNNRVCCELAAKIESHPELLCEVAGFLYLENAPVPALADLESGVESTTLRSFGIPELLKKERVDELIMVLPANATQEVQNVMGSCREANIKVRFVPQSYELYLSKFQLSDIGGVPLISLERAQLSWTGRIAKRTIDVLVAAIMGIASLPLIIVCASVLCLRKGSAFSREMRVGEHGREFYMYRFNVSRDLPEVQGLERFMRHFSISELPQLVNVIRGDMSLVGPRPEPPERVKHYSDWQKQRLNVMPGLTGLAQVHGLRELHSSEEKASFDLQYIQGWSLGLDVSLVVQTIWTLLHRIGSFGRREMTIKLAPERSQGS